MSYHLLILILIMKYSLGDLKTDSVTGALNGLTFGLIYAFYTLPFEFQKPEIKEKFKARPIRYYGSWGGRMALAFGILRSTFSAISKEEVGLVYEVAGMGGATLIVAQVLF